MKGHKAVGQVGVVNQKGVRIENQIYFGTAGTGHHCYRPPIRPLLSSKGDAKTQASSRGRGFTHVFPALQRRFCFHQRNIKKNNSSPHPPQYRTWIRSLSPPLPFVDMVLVLLELWFVARANKDSAALDWAAHNLMVLLASSTWLPLSDGDEPRG